MAFSALALAAVENQPLHSSGDKTYWDRKHNQVELIGHAVVSQPGETLTADYIHLDMNTRVLDARGNCVYVAQGTIIRGEEMHFNLDTRTGAVVRGRVSNEQFSLSGERINRLGEGRFQTHWGEYSTCHDCPQSWSLRAQDVDLQVEGYAYMNNVTAQVDDAPAFWLPYLIFPVKSKRQTGFLFPKFAISDQNGFQFVEPFFWAINRSSDMTIGVGEYTKKGARVEWEGRYALSDLSKATFDAYYIRDTNPSGSDQYIDPLLSNRWTVTGTQAQELPWHMMERLRLAEVSDNLYPWRYPLDLPAWNSTPTLNSDLIISRPDPFASFYVAAHRFRNLLDLNTPEIDPVTGANTLHPNLAEFDKYTVQEYPEAVATTKDKFIFGSPPVAANLTLGYANFTRDQRPFDQGGSAPGQQPVVPPVNSDPLAVYRPGLDPLRIADRFSVVPSIYTTLRPFDVVSVVPSVQYREYYYDFHGFVPNLNHGYLLTQVDLSTQLERIYDLDNPDVPRMKHLIRPMLTYSLIPYMDHAGTDSNPHPFLQQIDYGRTQGYNYYFDSNDVVPLTNVNLQSTGSSTAGNSSNYFYPLGNAVAYGFDTQLIKRQGNISSESPSYTRMVDWAAGQSFDIRSLRNDPANRYPFSRFYSTLDLNFGSISSSSNYYYYPYLLDARNHLDSSFTYALERTTHQKVLTFDRSLNLNYTYDLIGCHPGILPANWPPGTPPPACGTSILTSMVKYSVSDYVLPSVGLTYDFIQKKTQSALLDLIFQSPSRCWRFEFTMSFDTTNLFTYAPDLSLNLTGLGFGGLTEGMTASQTQ